ncbi:MAG: hypothetical protein RR198_04420 [Oscillospiraceae bacterium]
MENGNKVIEITEGNIYDELIYCTDGSILLNGKPVIVENEQRDVMPMTTWLSYFSINPLRGGTSGYTYKSQSNGNVRLEQKFLDTTLGALVSITGKVLGIPEKYLDVIDLSSLKTIALQYSPNANAFSYTRNLYENLSLSTSMDKYYRHNLTYKLVTGQSAGSSVYYENYFLV